MLKKRLNPKVPPSSSTFAVEIMPDDYRRRHRKKQVLVGVALGSIGIIIGIIGLMVFKSWWTLRHVLAEHTGARAEALQNQAPLDPELSKLQREGDQRVNILLLGIGDSTHAGSLLSDTVLVASIEPQDKTVTMVSLPRDLYVPIPGHGSDKLNAAHSYGEQQKTGQGPELARQVVSKVLNIPIQYYARADFTGFRKIVDTLGGVPLTVTTSLYDPEYPCENDEGRACGFTIKAGAQVVRGDMALKYVRCRKGNCGNDFGRAARQQEVLIAMRAKALSLETLTNPAKIVGLLDAIGSHAKTDLSLEEIQNLTTILKDVSADKTTTKVIDDETTNLVHSTWLHGASVVVPKLGDGDFTALQDFTHELLTDRYIKREAAHIIVHNATGESANTALIRQRLSVYGYDLTSVDEIENTARTSLKDYTKNAKPFTRTYLERRFHINSEQADGRGSSADLEITLGSDFQSEWLQ